MNLTSNNIFFHFYRAACNATHAIAVPILSAVFLSARLSVRRVYCDKTNDGGYFDNTL